MARWWIRPLGWKYPIYTGKQCAQLSLLCSPTSLNLFVSHSAKAQPVTPVASRSATPIANLETFDPARPSVDPVDSALLPISKVPSYLDSVLKTLALHTEARTSFITLRILSFSTPPIFVFGRNANK